MDKATVKQVREGSYAAEVEVRLMDDESGWPPYLPLDDVHKLEAVRHALRSGNLESARRFGRAWRLPPLFDE